jgi:hypothetical protein
MKRCVVMPILAAMLMVLGGARQPAPFGSAAVRARQLRQDRRLVARFVQGGLALARSRLDDPLERAQCCDGVARDVAEEIERSLDEQDAVRAELLGDHFRRLLVNGVVPNLNEARQKVPPGSTDERKLLDLGERNVRLTNQLESKLRQPAAEPKMEVILRAVADARSEVQKTLPAAPKKK